MFRLQKGKQHFMDFSLFWNNRVVYKASFGVIDDVNIGACMYHTLVVLLNTFFTGTHFHLFSC